MSCFFASSKYYKEAKVDATEIAPPLGYEFLNSNKDKKKINLPSAGQLVLKEVFDKTHHRLLANKKIPY